MVILGIKLVSPGWTATTREFTINEEVGLLAKEDIVSPKVKLSFVKRVERGKIKNPAILDLESYKIISKFNEGKKDNKANNRPINPDDDETKIAPRINRNKSEKLIILLLVMIIIFSFSACYYKLYIVREISDVDRVFGPI